MKGSAGKWKTNNSYQQNGELTNIKPCIIHGVGNSSEQNKVLKGYRHNYRFQRPYKPNNNGCNNSKNSKK